MKTKWLVVMGCLGILLAGCCTTSTTTYGTCGGASSRVYSKTCSQSRWPYYWTNTNDCQCANQMCGRIPCLSTTKCCSAFGNIGASSYPEEYHFPYDNDPGYADFDDQYPVSYK